MADEDLYSGYGDSGPLAAGYAASGFGPTSTPYAPDAFYRPASRSGAVSDQASTHAQMRLGTAIAPSQGQMRLGTAVVPSYAHMRLGTAVAPGTARIGTASSGEGGARPMTSNKGAGYRSTPRGRFDPLNQAGSGGTSPLDAKLQPSPEEQCLEAEAKVHLALEQSAEAHVKGDASGGLTELTDCAALERAKEAGKRERGVCKLRERFGLLEQINSDLTYAVAVNLAQAYHAAQLYSEALNSFTQIVRSKQFPQAHLLRINMGNIYFEQHKYPSAIKMYRMALDQVPLTSRSVRSNILRNIGVAFMRVGQYQDAMQSMTGVLDAEPDPQAAFNLVLCTYALGDKERMKQAFAKLVEVVPSDDLEEEDSEVSGSPSLLNDELIQEMRSRRAKMHSYVLTASRLLAPVIERLGPVAGFDWCMEALTAAQHSGLASEVALAKAAWFLNHQAFGDAVSVLKDFEKKEHKLKARAATNLAFLYSLEGESANAEQYADLAVSTDKYSAQALVNKGVVAAKAGDLLEARSHFMDAVSLEADCAEAIYNLGLVSRAVGNLEDALTAFKKMNSMLIDDTAAMFQIAALYDMMGDPHGALEWFQRLNLRVPQDPGVLARLGAIHARLGDEAEALRCYQDAHRMFPANMDVISWLGAFHVKNEMYETAAPFFELAAQVQPQEVKWHLMVASCIRRTGNQQQALSKYKQIHGSYPSNTECLRYLVHICNELGLKDDEAEYTARMRKAERQQANTRDSQSREGWDEQSQGAARQDRGLTPDLAIQTVPSRPEEPAFQMPISKAKKAQLVAKRDEDEWGTGELGEDLLPQ